MDNKAAYIDESGKLIIDLAEADKLWEGLTKDQQFEVMCTMFYPILDRATLMHGALRNIIERCNEQSHISVIKDIAEKALPK